jgi:16S rRNA (guanine1207-N2)-methyltransferase
MNNALALLSESLIQHCLPQSRLLFLHAQYDAALFNRFEIKSWQPFKPFYEPLPDAEGNLNNIDDSNFDSAAILIPKNVTEARYAIACAWARLKDNGVLVFAAENDANGKRLSNWAKELGTEFSVIKAKKSCCITIEKIGTPAALNEWKDAGGIQANGAGFYTQPGLFSWDRADAGSTLLLDAIDTPLRGNGADFGCGYGYLSRGILDRYEQIKSLSCIDADARALECCTQNLNEYSSTAPIWANLSDPWKNPVLMDFIVMNPPFHEGKKADSHIGQEFIKNAARNLKRNGVLWMVANSNLPYESTLQQNFTKYEIKTQKQGFKIIFAVK